MSKKKRLALLPEVLPKPQVVSPGQSSVRSRTLARLSALAALGAAGIAASCTSGTSSGEGDGGGPFGLPDGGRESGPDAYGVVDPLPPPSCFKSGAPTVTAFYILDAGTADAGSGPRSLVVDLKFPEKGVMLGIPTASNGVMPTSFGSKTDGAQIGFNVPAGVTTSFIRVPVSCTGGPSTVSFTASFGDATITITDLSY